MARLIAVATSPLHTIGLLDDGSVVFLHANNKKIQSLPDLKDIVKIQSGLFHYAALDQNGKVWTWGENLSYQPRTTDHRIARMALKLPPVKSIAASDNRTLSLSQKGDVWLFGENLPSRFFKDTLFRLEPATTIKKSGLQNIKALACTLIDNYALDTNGRVFMWSGNEQSSRAKPIRISILPPVKAISGGNDHALFLAESGQLFAWGSNGNGNLLDYPVDWSRGFGGISPSDPNSRPILLPLSPLKSISCGTFYSAALSENNKLFAWGGPFGNKITTLGNNQDIIPLLFSSFGGMVLEPNEMETVQRLSLSLGFSL